MKRVLVLVVCVFALMGATTATLAQQVQVVTGQTGSNAHYRIEVPPVWNGDLVIWNHGLDLDPPGPVTHAGLGPLVDVQLAEGYAVAASSYRLNGWALPSTNTDLKNLYDIFKRRFGTPAQVILSGVSLGGIVTIQAVEQANIGNVVGAFSLCGAIAGSRNWDGALDIRLVYDAVCGAVPGAAIPGGAEGLPKDSTFTPAQLGAAINACFAPTPQGLQRLGQFLAVTKIPANFIGTDMGYVTFAMSDLVHDPHKLAGKVGTGNEMVDYGDPSINAAIARVAPNPGAANRLEAFYTPTGDTRRAKIVSLHTDKDGLVLVENESEYASRTDPANFTAAIVVESTPSHCGFTPAETLAGWEVLRSWVAGAPQPSPAAIQGTCLAVAPLVGGPCRIDPTFVVPDMDGRIRPRQ